MSQPTSYSLAYSTCCFLIVSHILTQMFTVGGNRTWFTTHRISLTAAASLFVVSHGEAELRLNVCLKDLFVSRSHHQGRQSSLLSLEVC